MIYSYDIFDTLFCRIFFVPNDMYFFLEKRLKEDDLIDNGLEFSRVRIQTEEKVRSTSIKEDINFDEIYQELGKNLSLSPYILNKIKNLELEFEEFSISIIDEIRKKIDEDSILISDIYLNKEFIEYLLKKFNISYRTLYLSSELGLMKYYGSLFEKILIELKVKGNQITHEGDNKHSDVKMPKKFSLKTSYFMNSKPTRYENQIYRIIQEDKINSIFAGSMKSSRLEVFFPDNDKQTIWNVATNVAGPFLFLYCFWILKKAHKLKIKNLYFIARDGQILLKIAKILNRYLGYNINLKYLLGSRKAWHLASLEDISERELDWIFDPTQFLSVNTICSRVEIDPKSIAVYLHEIGLTNNNNNLSESEIEKLRNLFLSNETVLELIINKAKEKRILVSKYLKQEGFDSNSTIGIVDVGWRARQQNSLSRILELEGLYPDSGVNGFYLSLPNKVEEFSNDRTFEYLPFKENDMIIYGYSAIFESFTAADHGSCISYKLENGVAIPVLREKKNSKMEAWGLEIHQKGILSFSQKFTDSIAFLNINEIKDSEIFSKTLLDYFLKYPSKQEALTYGKIYCFEDQEEDNGLNLSRKLSMPELLIALVRPRIVFHPNMWKEGSFAISIKKYYFLYQDLFQIAHKVMRKIR